MESKLRGVLTPQLVLGLCVIFFGLTLTLDNLELISGRMVLLMWPFAPMAMSAAYLFGVGRALDPQSGHRLLRALPWMVLSMLFLLKNFGILHVHLWDLWPVGLMFVGGALVWQTFNRKRAHAADRDSLSTVSAFALMSGIERSSSTNDFCGGELTAVMGGVGLDLRQAQIAGGEATLDVFAFWGGIELKVPENWVVVGKVAPLMGGYVDKTRPPKHDSSQRLIIRGVVIMGGIEVRN